MKRQSDPADVPAMLSSTDICTLAHISRWTLARWRRNGDFPRPVVAKKNTVRWLTADYLAWIKRQEEERDAPRKPPRRRPRYAR